MRKKAKYCVGLNGRAGNLETLMERYGNKIYEVYAAAPPDVCTSGRWGHVPLTLEQLRRQVEIAHSYGVRYNVVMNGSCISGREFSSSFTENIKSFVAYLDELEVDSTTIANPFIIDLVRKYSKRIEIIVSSFSEVVEPYKIGRFKKRGANRVVLHQNVYRNFKMLKKLQKESVLPLEIIPNQGCIYQCECFISHINIVAHSSVLSEDEVGILGEFNTPIHHCRALRQTDPIEFLMSNIIRPEDLTLYEKLGFEFFKFAGRRSSTEWIINVLDAYLNRSYEGNIFDLASHVGENKKICMLPNKALRKWYTFMGSNDDCERFRKKAFAYDKKHNISSFFQI